MLILSDASNNSLNRSANKLAFHRELVRIGVSSRPINSGVRFLLDDLAQRQVSSLASPESHSYALILTLLECSEPIPASRAESVVR
jgi:hypothetical protein